jgi:hypothetical protein
LEFFQERELRQRVSALMDGSVSAPDPEFVSFVLEKICGFTAATGSWQRGANIGPEWGRRSFTGETVKPRQIWRGPNDAILPVFFDNEVRLGIGRGRKSASQTVQWLRSGKERLALLTNGRQWRLIFAGLDFDAWCEWDIDLWFEEGTISPQINALRVLLSPRNWTPSQPDTQAPLLAAILDSRKGQSELSASLGERVREAVELLVRSHGEALKEKCSDIDPSDIYRAAVRVVMRMVVVLFAESRELLPRDNALYYGAYGLTGLLEELEKVAARGGNRLARSWNAWPRVLALFRLVHQGSHHSALPVPAYGGELFAQGDDSSTDGLSRSLAVFETASFAHEIVADRDVHGMLERITRTRIKLPQGLANIWVPAPVDFSDLSSEYIGILYEGLLDFELKTAPAGDPVIFLAVGNQPALPLSRLEAMDDKALANLLEKMKDTSKGDEPVDGDQDNEIVNGEEVEGEDECAEDAVSEQGGDEVTANIETEEGDERHNTRMRAETWARRAVEIGKLVPKPKGAITPEKRHAYEDAVSRKAKQLVIRVVLPGEWYVVRWGGTRKGSGTFYTRPGLAVPTVQRTLRPLVYTPPPGVDGTPDIHAPHTAWAPKKPEDILALKVCDPACGSGTFPVAALRFLTDALFVSLHHHGRISEDGDRAVVRLLAAGSAAATAQEERLAHELLPCRPDDAFFEQRLKAVLRRHVVERSIYGVDLDPLAVELCRLALWVETMDRTLPFSFLDHKIKCGNALVGAWFDQFQHYPVMAWKNREGGDKGHGNGVHFEKEARTKAIKAFVRQKLTPDVLDAVTGQYHLQRGAFEQPDRVHADALATLSRLHSLPVQDSAERAHIYREELLGSQTYRSLKAAMDLSCACWFWPVDQIEHAPLPTTMATPPEETRSISTRVAARKRFFHWELEFPDVFWTANSGFDAVLGNPPWDIAKPNSKEFFSNIDPLYRSYAKQEALGYQNPLPEGESRCAQPPYDKIPIARAEIPAGIILSREARAWIREERVEDTALPLYQGLMIWTFDCSFNGWESGTGRSAKWHQTDWQLKCLEPQYLVSLSDYYEREKAIKDVKVCSRRITTAVHQRTAIVSLVPNFPCGDVASVIQPSTLQDRILLPAALNIFPVDFVAKKSCTYLHLDWHVLEAMPAPRLPSSIVDLVVRLNCFLTNFAPLRLQLDALGLLRAVEIGLTPAERLRLDINIQAVGISILGLTRDDVRFMFRDCDQPSSYLNSQKSLELDPKGFWRVDKDRDPELRHTVLTFVAFSDLEDKIRACDGGRVVCHQTEER